jgi:hypothetical protein
MLHAILDDPTRDWPDVTSRITSAGITILEEAPGEPSLEDVFIQLVTSAPAHA